MPGICPKHKEKSHEEVGQMPIHNESILIGGKEGDPIAF
jgi:hypothetical protein